jgi:hypothetical protein
MMNPVVAVSTGEQFSASQMTGDLEDKAAQFCC